MQTLNYFIIFSSVVIPQHFVLKFSSIVIPEDLCIKRLLLYIIVSIVLIFERRLIVWIGYIICILFHDIKERTGNGKVKKHCIRGHTR